MMNFGRFSILSPENIIRIDFVIGEILMIITNSYELQVKLRRDKPLLSLFSDAWYSYLSSFLSKCIQVAHKMEVRKK
jgi:hypothetical protein